MNTKSIEPMTAVNTMEETKGMGRWRKGENGS